MPSEPTIAPPASPVAGIDPPSIPKVTGTEIRPPTSTPRRSPPVRLARKAMSVLRGDKYMAGAYPPEWAASPTHPEAAVGSDPKTAMAAGANGR
jgi:hypothetical protein